MLYRSPRLFAAYPRVIVAESTRHGGVSPTPWHSLNLGKSTADDPQNVMENRRRICTALGFSTDQLAWSKQVHGLDVRVATAPGGSEGFDAHITNTPGILLAVSVADCTPILIYDAKNQAVAAIHAGWKGTCGELVFKTLKMMSENYGTKGRDCFAYIGTCIDECSFEVGPEVAEQFEQDFKKPDPGRNKFFVDLKKANAAQLLRFGVPDDQLEISPYSTVLHNEDYFSHRKEKGITGRMMGLIGVLP
jgi:YfiH family protein